MAIELTPEEQRINLRQLLASCEAALLLDADMECPIRYLRKVTRVALWLAERWTEAQSRSLAGQHEESRLREQLDKVLGDLNFVRGERDKLAAELELRDYRENTPFFSALDDLETLHGSKLDALPAGERDEVDPFGHQANSYKHGMGIDSFPLVEVEQTLAGPGMGSYESWRRIAHAAVLAMSYLRYVEQEEKDWLQEPKGEAPEDAA